MTKHRSTKQGTQLQTSPKINLNLPEGTKLVNGSEIEKNAGFVYNPHEGETSLADVDFMLDQVAKILEEMCTDEIQELKKLDKNKYEQTLEFKFETFALEYWAIFKKVISGEDLGPLFQMLGEIAKIKTGEKSLKQVETELGHEYAVKFGVLNPDGTPKNKFS